MSGEGLELQRVEGVLPAADVLHRVLPPAALAVEKETRVGGVRNTNGAQLPLRLDGVIIGGQEFNLKKHRFFYLHIEAKNFYLARNVTV